MGVTGTTTEKPRHWGSWKGRVIKAIVIDDAQTWDEIRDFTGLSSDSLNVALSELYEMKILKRGRDGTYRVKKAIYDEYWGYIAEPRHQLVQESHVKFSEKKQKGLIRWIDMWREVKNLGFSVKHKHFFLVGRHLDDLSKELISHAESEVLAVNPYVDKCDLANTLRGASKRGVDVVLITRPPEIEKGTSRYDRQEYHKFMKEEGIGITYNKWVHAKLIVVDRAVAAVSSMNLYSGSSGGASWEAGLISVEETVVESVANSILRLLEMPESIEA